MRLLVYCAVFGGYDRVYPPVRREADLDYVIVTDDHRMRVPGWRTHVVDAGGFPTPKAANLYYRALIHRELPGYDASLYTDGNIRLLGRTSEVFAPFLASGAALGVYPHPLRDTVEAEIEACLTAGKVANPDLLRAEWAEYRAAGFPDNQGLIETTIMLKNHRAPDLDAAMQMWWALFRRRPTRDQISLPYVKWKTGVSCVYHEGSFRDPNPHFGLYPHRGDPRAPALYADMAARAFDSLPHRLALRAWHGVWALRRALRTLRAGGPA